MSQLGWEELRLIRTRIKTILLFKIVYNIVDIPSEPFLILTGAITRRHNVRLLQPHTRTITMQYSFFPSAIRTWNIQPKQLPWPTPPLYHGTSPSVLIVYTGRLIVHGGWAVLFSNMNSVSILNHEFCTYRRRGRRIHTGVWYLTVCLISEIYK
jgi:hypothetical protein